MLVNSKGKVKISRDIKVGDIVLIGSDNSKRVDWPLARVKELFPGKDGNERVVRLVTTNGEFIRPIQRIFPLELNQDDSDHQMNKILTTNCKNLPKPNSIICEENHRGKTNDTKVVITRSGRIPRKPNRLEYS